MSHASGDHIVEAYSSAFVVLFICLLYVSIGSRVSPSIFWLMLMGSVMLFICVCVCISCRYDGMFAFDMFMSMSVDVVCVCCEFYWCWNV